jgi:hypothetical protein
MRCAKRGDSMSVNAISQAGGADLVSALAQNVAQGATPDTTAGTNVLKKAIDLSQNSTSELIASEGEGNSSGGRLNVYG